MKTKNKPVFIPDIRRLAETSPAQRDSENSILGMGLMRVIGLMGLMRRKQKSKNGFPQRDSKMSSGRLSGVFCRWQGGTVGSSNPAVAGPIRRLEKCGSSEVGEQKRFMRQKHKNKNCPAQSGSEISNLILTPSPLRPLRLNLLCAQLDSGMSILVSHLRNLRNLRTNLLSAQLDSGISILRMRKHCHTASAENTKDVIFTMLIKNIAGCFMGCWGNEPMSKMQNVSAQRYSEMSNLKIKTENILPQRHSRMSILDFGGTASAEHLKQAMFIERIKNMADCFGRLFGQREILIPRLRDQS